MSDNTVLAIAILCVIAVVLLIRLVILEYREMKQAKIDAEYRKSCRELDRHFATIPKD